MTTATLERTLPPIAGRRLLRFVPGLLAAACLALVAMQVRDVDFGPVFAQLNVGWLLLATVAFAVSLGLAAHNISAFAPVRLRAADTVRAQLAVGALRMIAPSAVSTPAVGARFLTSSGVGTAESLTVVATAQAAQLLMTVVVVAAIAATGAEAAQLPLPHAGPLGLGAAGVAALVVTAVLIGRRWAPLARLVAGAAEAGRSIATHLRQHPGRVVTGLAASAGLTLAHVAAFACCVHAAGGHASLFALTAIYLGAAGAGSLVPTPGGVGAVEAAMISGLVATGLSPATATAAALLTRLVTVWAPALPGWWALRSLRRARLL